MRWQRFFPLRMSFLVCVFAIVQQGDATTLVYNMRIRRVFNVSPLLGPKKPLFVPIAVPIIARRDRDIVIARSRTDVVEKRSISGTLFNFRYIPSKDWWFELTSGIEREQTHTTGTTTINARRTGLDDIVLAGGHNLFFGDNTQFVLYGLCGFPARHKVTLQEIFDPLVGTRFFSVGAGSEISYRFLRTDNAALIGVLQARCIHFFSRRWEPILPADAKIQPGNVTDILCALQYRYRLNLFEVGYNPTIFTDQAIVLPTETIRTNTFVRNSYYVNYAHLWKRGLFGKKPLILGAGANIGRAKFYNTKIASCWLTIGSVF
jgi:hypothetical protein